MRSRWLFYLFFCSNSEDRMANCQTNRGRDEQWGPIQVPFSVCVVGLVVDSFNASSLRVSTEHLKEQGGLSENVIQGAAEDD
ncbi:hypothetical protein BJX99DRAFT_227776 [Aspergillus californicus]